LLEPLRSALPGIEIVQIEGDGPLAQDIRGEILLTYSQPASKMADVLDRGIRWVHVYSTGVDGFPFELLGDRVMTCSRGASAQAISEWVIAVMLAFEKQLPEIFLSEPAEQWYSARLGSLQDKKLALIGFGSIAQAIARRAAPFGMRIAALRRTQAPASVEGVQIAASLGELLEDADHVVVAAPATPATLHLLDDKAFSMMKPGAHLVNIARGEIVDQDALRRALDRERIGRATLDCVTPEPLPAGHWLYAHPLVRLSAHVSWSSPHLYDRLSETFIENVRRYQRGEELIARVDPDEQY